MRCGYNPFDQESVLIYFEVVHTGHSCIKNSGAIILGGDRIMLLVYIEKTVLRHSIIPNHWIMYILDILLCFKVRNKTENLVEW